MSAPSYSELAGRVVLPVIGVGILWASIVAPLTALAGTPGSNPLITDTCTTGPAPLVVGNGVCRVILPPADTGPAYYR